MSVEEKRTYLLKLISELTEEEIAAVAEMVSADGSGNLSNLSK